LACIEPSLLVGTNCTTSFSFSAAALLSLLLNLLLVVLLMKSA